MPAFQIFMNAAAARLARLRKQEERQAAKRAADRLLRRARKKRPGSGRPSS
jgi:hypothetical protein